MRLVFELVGNNETMSPKFEALVLNQFSSPLFQSVSENAFIGECTPNALKICKAIIGGMSRAT